MNETNGIQTMEFSREQAIRERREAWMQMFERGLAGLKLEFRKTLQQAIPAGREALERELRTFASRLEFFQHEFLGQLPRVAHVQTCGGHSMVAGETGWMPEVGGAMVVGGAVLTGLLLPTVATTVGHLWWTHTVMVSAASVVAGVLGLPVSLVTGGGAAVAAIGTGIAIHKSLEAGRRRELENALMERFRLEVEPKLRAWARQAVDASVEAE